MIFRIDTKMHIKTAGLSLVMALPFLNKIIMTLVSFLVQPPLHFLNNRLLDLYIYMTFIAILTSIAHELIHGIWYMLFGGRVSFGFRIIYAYTREITGKPLTRTQFLMVLLMPLAIISLLCIPIGGRLGDIIFIINLLSSSADIYMAISLCRLKNDSYIVDRSYGFEVITVKPEI